TSCCPRTGAPPVVTIAGRGRDMAVDDFEIPRSSRRRLPSFTVSPETFGRGAEAFARSMGTPAFLVGMTVFCTVWLLWTPLLPESWHFAPPSLNFTLPTLILYLQASYATPLFQRAENRSTYRHRVVFEHDSQRFERDLACTE